MKEKVPLLHKFVCVPTPKKGFRPEVFTTKRFHTIFNSFDFVFAEAVTEELSVDSLGGANVQGLLRHINSVNILESPLRQLGNKIIKIILLYTQYFPDFCEKNHRHILLGWDLNPMALVVLEKCHTN